MKLTKQALLTGALTASISCSLLSVMYSTAASATTITATANDVPQTLDFIEEEIIYDFSDGKLHEKSGDMTLLSFTKQELPSSCRALKVKPITEKHTTQPSTNIVGMWQMEEAEIMPLDDMPMSDVDINDKDFVMPSKFYMEIKANGQLNNYGYVEEDKSCYLQGVTELDGNKLVYGNDYNVEIAKVKITTLDKQLAVINLVQEVANIDGAEPAFQSIESYLYDKAASLPTSCDIRAKVPSAEKSNDNPNSNLVGTWQDNSSPAILEIADIDSTNNAAVTANSYYIVTADGFLLTAFYENFDGDESCQVDYIGETVGDLYTK